MPLARAAFEHAITLQLVFISDGGIDRFNREVMHNRISQYTTLATWLNNTEFARLAAQRDAPPAGKRLAPFGTLFTDPDQERFLATSYHALSQQVHVTHAVVVAALARGREYCTSATSRHIPTGPKPPKRCGGMHACPLCSREAAERRGAP